MTLASGAEYSIAGLEYRALERGGDDEPHTAHDLDTLFANTQAIAGEIAKDQLHPDRILWSLTDFIGGEGATIYYPQNPTQYDQASLMNVTKRGQLTTRTERRRSNVARAAASTITSNARRVAGASAYTHAVIGWEQNIVVSTDAITWTNTTDTTPQLLDSDIADAISDGTNVAFTAFTLGGSATADAIPVVSVDASTTTWADANTGTLPDIPIVGTVLDGVPYTFGLDSTLKVFKKAAVMDTAADWAATIIYNTGIAPVGTWGTDYWTSAVAGETAIYVSYSTKSHSFVWEIQNDVGRPFFTGDPGFSVKKLLFKRGILFLVGNNAGAGSNFARLEAIPIQTGTSVTAAEPRKHLATSLGTFAVGCPGNGDYLFLGDENSGKIFLYDIQHDALSLFDDLANGGTGDGVVFTANTHKISTMFMHGARLCLAITEPGDTNNTNLQVVSYDDLEVQSRDDSQAISATLETAEWDGGLPMELKGLIGFYVNFKVTDAATTSGLIANSRITISYKTEGAAAYTDTTIITSATTPTGVKGRVFIAAPTGTNTVAFNRLKVKITLDNNATAVAPPIHYSTIVEMAPMAYSEVWDLLVRVEDETQNERTTLRANKAPYLRDALEDLVQNKDIVTFLDGSRYPWPHSTAQPGYTTHTVRVESVKDHIVAGAEGFAQVRLRAVTSA